MIFRFSPNHASLGMTESEGRRIGAQSAPGRVGAPAPTWQVVTEAIWLRRKNAFCIGQNQSTECTSSGRVITKLHPPALLEQVRTPRRRILVGTSSGKAKSIFAPRKFSVSGFSLSSPVMNFADSIFVPAADEVITTKKSAVP